MKKILISVAPVCATEHEYSPVAVAEDVIHCYHEGAAMAHLHCRNVHGALTDDVRLLQQTITLIRRSCPILLQVSTGGVSELTIRQRCAPCDIEGIESHSLNVGSVNLGEAVYQNPIADVAYCVQRILERQRIPEVEVFEPGMIFTAHQLHRQFHFVSPLLFAIVLGHRGAMPATEQSLRIMLEGLRAFYPDEKRWGITQAGRKDWTLIGTALELGADTVRIGFEDSACLDEGVTADQNAPMVRRLADILREKGLRPATPDEARRMLGR